MNSLMDLLTKYERVIFSRVDEADDMILEAMRYIYTLQKMGWLPNLQEFFFRLVLDETVYNALKHGNRCNPVKRITLTIEPNPEFVVVTVTDEGLGFCPDMIPDPKLEENRCKLHGRGILLLKNFGKVSWNDKGNSICVQL